MEETMKADLIIRGGQLVCADSIGLGHPKTKKELDQLDVIERGSIITEDGKIKWFGAMGKEPKIDSADKSPTVVTAYNTVIMPGLVDPHTHLVFAGSRAQEFEAKIAGMTYEEIHNSGVSSGIRYTTEMTRKAFKKELILKGLKDLDIMLEHGTTTVEIKSGYGLSRQHELKILEIIQELSKRHVIDIVPTFLGAHTVPAEYKDKREEYVKLVINMLPEIKKRGLADFCDVFCDKLGFSLEESKKILIEAKGVGFKLKLHAEQTGCSKGAWLGSELGATSIDHLDYISEIDIKRIAKSETVGVLLPGVTYHLMEIHKNGGWIEANRERMAKEGAPIALATDYNPGSCPTQSMQAVMELAARIYRMSPAQIINAATINAAWAINRAHEVGSITVGKKADLAIFDCRDYRDIINIFGVNKVQMVVKNGKIVVDRRNRKL